MPEAGKALEILGHALDYLTDEYVAKGEFVSVPDRHFEAIQLLMSINRSIYFSCPEEIGIAERWKQFWQWLNVQAPNSPS